MAQSIQQQQASANNTAKAKSWKLEEFERYQIFKQQQEF